MTDFFSALALVFVIEGIVLALFPDRLRWLLERLAEMPPEVIRKGGLFSAVVGILALWFIRG